MTPAVLPRLLRILTGILLGIALALWIWKPGGGRREGAGESHFLPQPLPAPTFTLTSQEGIRVSSGDFPGKVLAVFFGYTSCPDVCPLTLSNLSRAFQRMGEEGERIQVLLITVDPARDTPDRMREYLEAFHPSFLGLTGTEEEIRAVADAFGVFFAKVGEGDRYTVDHTARVFVLTPAKEIPLTFPVSATPEEMAGELSRLLGEVS